MHDSLEKGNKVFPLNLVTKMSSFSALTYSLKKCLLKKLAKHPGDVHSGKGSRLFNMVLRTDSGSCEKKWKMMRPSCSELEDIFICFGIF